jgi:hypothetical protein
VKATDSNTYIITNLVIIYESQQLMRAICTLVRFKKSKILMSSDCSNLVICFAIVTDERLRASS